MRITDIQTQAKDKTRVNIFVDRKYSFSLTGDQLGKIGLKIGGELTDNEIKTFQEQSEIGKIEAKVLRFLSFRVRSEWEVEEWFKRKSVSPSIASRLIDQLKKWNYIDDRKFAEAWIRNRRQLKAVSKTRLRQELKAKRIDNELIDEVLSDDETDDKGTLKRLIANKRRQSRYQDDQKLMAYLGRQGFGYSDIKAAMDMTGEES